MAGRKWPLDSLAARALGKPRAAAAAVIVLMQSRRCMWKNSFPILSPYRKPNPVRWPARDNTERRAHEIWETRRLVDRWSRVSRRDLRVPAPVPPISRRGILGFRAAAGLSGKNRMGVRPAHVSAGSERRLSRTLRWRLA